MTEINEKKTTAKPNRWRSIPRLAAALLLLLVLFHRPLLRSALKSGLVRAAASQNIRLTFELEGDVFHELRFKQLRGVPSGVNHLNKLEAEEIHIQYSLVSLLTHGVEHFLKNCEVRNLWIEITPVFPGSLPKKKEPGEILHDVLHPPFFIADRYHVENLTFVSHTPDGDFILGGVQTLLDVQGFVKIEQLKIPNVHTWMNLSAETTYKNRKLTAHSFSPDPHLRVISFEWETHPDTPYHMALEAAAFGGTVVASLSGKNDSDEISQAHFSGTLHNGSIQEGFAYFNHPISAEGTLLDFSMEFQGNPNRPRTWDAHVTAQIEAGGIGAVKLETTRLQFSTRNGTAQAEVEINQGQNKLRMTSGTRLPEDSLQFSGTSLDGQLEWTFNEPGRFDSRITKGSIAGKGTFWVNANKLSLKAEAIAKEMGGPEFSLSKARVNLDATKNWNPNGPSAPFLNGLETSIQGDLSDFSAAGYTLDTGKVALETAQDRLTVSTLDFKRGPNTVQAHGECLLPNHPTNWRAVPFDATFSAEALALNQLYTEPRLTGLKGRLALNGTLKQKNSVIDGDLSLTGTNLSFGEFSAEKLNIEVPITQNTAHIATLDLRLNSTDSIAGTGIITVCNPFHYEGQLAATIHDLARFNPLILAAGIQQPIGGSLLVNWHGSGNPRSIQHTGNGSIQLKKGALGDLRSLEISIAGNYSPESLDFPTFEIEADRNKLAAVVRLHQSALELSQIQYQFNHLNVASGTLQMPLDLRTPAQPETLIPPDGKISAALTLYNLPIESLMPNPKTPITGTVSGTLKAQGTLREPKATLQIQGRNLQPGSMPKLASAALDLNLNLSENRLALSGTLKQQEITPLQISGEIALPVLEIIRTKQLDQQSPIRLSVKLPKTSVAFLARLLPDLRFAEGQASMDAGIAGTLAKPEMHGAAQFDLPAVRFQNPDWPAINRFKGDLQFSGNRLSITRLGGEISGGAFNLGGQVQWEKLTEPVLDLRFTTQGALIARNETVTIRADSDIKIQGPFKQAEVTGGIGLTKSRFFREIELLPIQLPGRPAPQPPGATGRFSIQTPPFRDWKFNLAIKTKDPFLIRGNLTNGTALIDLKMGGTGFAPTLDGSIRIDNFTASLPFSTLEMSYGFIYFNQKNPFVPILDLQATSSLRDYNIRANIYGEASNPQTILSSDPPLPQNEILTLLATGATTQDLTGNSDVIAGRAAMLVFQHFYSKIFKHQEPTGNDSLLNRFQLDVGTVDPRTGKQEASARFKLGEKFYLIGSVNIIGDIRGQVKYLLQFR